MKKPWLLIILLILLAVGILKTLPSRTRSSQPIASTTVQPKQYAALPPPSKTSSCQENNGLPDSACTPGAIDPHVSQSTIASTICVSGYTKTVRPSSSYTNTLKTQQITAYGYSDTNLSDYEEDHLISLELGGSPDNPANLWPEPHSEIYGSTKKDSVENYLHSQVCSGTISLAEAQHEIATDWVAIYTGRTSAVVTNSTDDQDDNPATLTPTPKAAIYPLGTTGICGDGSYTQVIHHQGACSNHGGVKTWITQPSD